MLILIDIPNGSFFFGRDDEREWTKVKVSNNWVLRRKWMKLSNYLDGGGVFFFWVEEEKFSLFLSFDNNILSKVIRSLHPQQEILICFVSQTLSHVLSQSHEQRGREEKGGRIGFKFRKLNTQYSTIRHDLHSIEREERRWIFSRQSENEDVSNLLFALDNILKFNVRQRSACSLSYQPTILFSSRRYSQFKDKNITFQ